MVDRTGDIQPKAEVQPEGETELEIIRDIVESRGGVHLYYPNHRDQDGQVDDIHVDVDRSHFFPAARNGRGFIFVQNGDDQRWLKPEKSLYYEVHNSD